MAYQMLYNTAKVILRGKLLVMQAWLKNEIKRFQVNNVTPKETRKKQSSELI